MCKRKMLSFLQNAGIFKSLQWVRKHLPFLNANANANVCSTSVLEIMLPFMCFLKYYLWFLIIGCLTHFPLWWKQCCFSLKSSSKSLQDWVGHWGDIWVTFTQPIIQCQSGGYSQYLLMWLEEKAIRTITIRTGTWVSEVKMSWMWKTKAFVSWGCLKLNLGNICSLEPRTKVTS